MSQVTHCEHIRQQLSGYIDGTMPPGQREGYEAHLAACRECHQEYNALRAMVAELRELPTPRGPDLVAGVHRKMQRRLAGVDWRAWLGLQWDSAALRQFALAATAVLVVVVVASLPPGTVSQAPAVRDDAPAQLASRAEAERASAQFRDGSEPMRTTASNGLIAGEKKQESALAHYGQIAGGAGISKDKTDADNSMVVRRALRENKTAAMDQAIEGALSARGRADVRTAEPSKEYFQKRAMERNAQLAARSPGADAVFQARSGSGSGLASTRTLAVSSPPAAKAPAEEAPASKLQEALPATPVDAVSMPSGANEADAARYQWDVADFNQAGAKLEAWVSANFGMAVAVDHRTFIVTIPPALLPEFTRQFSTRQVTPEPSAAALADGRESATPAASQPFVTVWLELVRSQ